MPKAVLYSLLLLAFWSCENKQMNKPTLYQSSHFSVYSDSVTQGRYTAVAVSDTEITSNYQSPANATFSRLIAFKFCINGKDNEQVSGIDHHLVLYPKEGKAVSPILTFGQVDTARAVEPENNFLEENTQLTLRLDMRQVLDAFEENGYFTTFSGEKIYKNDFHGVYVAGGSAPLSWDFDNLPNRPQFQLKDTDNNGIYEVTLTMNPYNPDNFTSHQWKLEKDLSDLPQYQSSQTLVNALYNLSLEEMLQDIRPDSTFMAGAKWEGVWTRDVSYSIVLALAAIQPDVARNSLMHKVRDNKIIQDTGTGGAWPVSSDRTTWALAAWEIYKVTGSREWLQQAYAIIKQSTEDDLKTIVDLQTGLMRGESSFLDWREQTYPRWMEPIDIFVSENLGTNAVHYQTYRILADMAVLLGESGDKYQKVAESIQKSMNERLWLEDKGYYGQYLYGRHHLSLSPRSEALGEALCILFDVADVERQARVIQNTPVQEFGIPCIYPQIPGIPPYHNEGIWPFVQAYWTWAAAKTGNAIAVTQGLGAFYRQAALFINNKENFVARTGDFNGTEINSDRQLWSVAGNLATVYRVLFGMDFSANELVFQPFVPKSYTGTKTLTNFHYRKANLTIQLEGYGNRVQSVMLDGKLITKAVIPGNLQGKHELRMQLADNDLGKGNINLLENYVAPNTPQVQKTKETIFWQPIKDAVKYLVFKNGQIDTTTAETSFRVAQEKDYVEYQVMAIDGKGFQSFKSAPSIFINNALVKIEQAEKFAHPANLPYLDFTGNGFVELSKQHNTAINLKINVVLRGSYLVDFRYANGNGPINTENKCAIRTLWLNDQEVGTVVFPQRGQQEWSDWGYTNAYVLQLASGEHTLSLRFEPHNENMNGEVNTAMLDHLRLIKIH
ncbi:MAG: glycogen debranching protein [Bacteroidota bacterium]